MSAWTLKDIETYSYSFILAAVGICAQASDPYDYKSLVARGNYGDRPCKVRVFRGVGFWGTHPARLRP